MSSSDESTGLVGLLNDQGWNEVGELKAQLQRRVEELTEEEIAKLLSARQTLAQRASSAASGLSRAHAVIRSLDRRLALWKRRRTRLKQAWAFGRRLKGLTRFSKP